MVIVLSLLICIVGAIIVFTTFPAPTRWTEIGRAMLWMGLIAFLMTYHGGNPFVITGTGR
jgi:hypothetical protein